MNNSSCIVSLTGDPITVGHRDIIKRASKIFNFIYVLIPKTSSKAGNLLSFDQRVQAIDADLKDDGITNFKVLPINGALVDDAKRLGCNFIVRGLRNEQDLIYEMDMGAINRMLNEDVETIYLSCKPELSFVSSSMIRQLVKLGKYETAEKFTSHNTMKLLKRASTKVVALGGGIACGKSTVRNIFRKNGWTVLDCDVINREKVLGNPVILEKIKQTLSVYGNIDEDNISKSIAKIVFSDNEARSKLEAIAFPIIVDYIKAFCEDWRLTQSNKILIEVPLLFEPRAFEFNNLFDESIFVVSNHDTQIKRLIAKGYTKEDALNRIASQIDVQVKAKYADYIIENNTKDIYDLENEVTTLIKRI